MRKPPETRPRRGLEALAWVVTIVGACGVVAWHDRVARGYWDDQYRGGSLFMIHFVPGQVPPDRTDPVNYPAGWLGVMRVEADLAIGLLAGSAGLILVNAARGRQVRRCWRRPGAVACGAIVAAMVFCTAGEALAAAQQGRWPWMSPWNPFLNAWPNYELRIGLAVSGAWLVLAVMGRWRAERSAVDRVGRAIGGLWLGVTLYRIVAGLFIPFNNWGY